MISCGKRDRGIFIYSNLLMGVSRYMFLMPASSKVGTFGADGAVTKEFQKDHVSGMGGEFEKVVDKVTYNNDADTIRVLFLWAMVNYNQAYVTVLLLGIC